MNYEEAVQSIWRHSEGVPADEAAQVKEIIRYATLAPSGHNTQCWRFRLQNRSLAILPDMSRRTPVVDPDDHHLFVSLGCAAENLIQAGRAFGFMGNAEFSPAAGGVITVALERSKAEELPLFKAIPHRQCTRTDFDGKPLAPEELRLLESAGTGNGVAVILLTEREAMEKVLEYVVEGNTMQINNPAFVNELESWIRFSDGEAMRTGDGLAARSTGSPTAPRWLGRLLFRTFFRVRPENDKYARYIRSSAGIAVFVSNVDDKDHWVEAGRCYERFALQATALGIRNAFVNQPVEESRLRPEFAQALGLGDRRPDLVVRFGRGKEMPRSLRRPVESVLV
ncbi:Acg family FMN-binding oxidoreductase [Thiohalobacter thiocyanaticus]|uniref:Tat pathway signal protein n=1 Tax=Thiohalobacter thiocyanaticus TaxID=585455 RepID=A0A426QLJ0_9GAMM|nr:Tat pathway signal protein [Thiohalobacter thiocyanaticus]RRQ22634.1 Tat pathway signal protein [Thiohalobacter thiocyanaticus]